MNNSIDMGELLKPIVEVLWEKVAGPACLILLGAIAIMIIFYLIKRKKDTPEP